MTPPTRLILLCATALLLTTSSIASAAPFNRAGKPAPKAKGNAPSLATKLAKELRRTEFVLRTGLGQKHVSPKVRRRVMNTFNHGARKLKVSVRKAQKDGVVTRREARRIRRLTETVRHELRMELKPLYRGKLRRKHRPRGKLANGRRDGSGRFNPARQ